jgi:hypothetical protein
MSTSAFFRAWVAKSPPNPDPMTTTWCRSLLGALVLTFCLSFEVRGGAGTTKDGPTTGVVGAVLVDDLTDGACDHGTRPPRF